MDHDFDLAFDLLDDAAHRLAEQQYGITPIPVHNHGPILITTVHTHTPTTGHRLVLLAADGRGQLAAVEATAPDLEATPATRILKVRAGDLTFHGIAGTRSFRARTPGHTYLLTAGTGDEPMWTVTVDDHAPGAHDDLDDAIGAIATAARLVA